MSSKRKLPEEFAKSTTEQHEEQLIKYLKDQFKRTANRDEEGIALAMDESFKGRQDFITNGHPKVVTIREIYPILFEKKQFLAEFSRMKEKNVIAAFYQNLSKYSSTILECTSPLHPMKELIHEAISKALVAEEKEYIKCAGALLVLPDLLGEDITSVAKFEAKVSKSVYPMIVCESSIHSVLHEEVKFHIFIEERMVFETTDFIEAVLLRMASFYCINIQYPANFMDSTTLIEVLLLNIPPDAGEMNENVSERYKMIVLLN